MRLARFYLLLHPDDCVPPHSLDLTPGSRDSLKVERLTEAFRLNGFDPKEPALVGYPLNGKIQLLTGTHRHEAAQQAGIFLPVRIILRSDWEAAWGKPEAAALVSDVPLFELELKVVPEERPEPPGLDERMDFDRDWI